ncbi:hypothetical protein KAF44_27180 (plasmid) [Cupriavidus necator]|nr:hypothetical protein KAF44_27180 [Cupriavidus necator]
MFDQKTIRDMREWFFNKKLESTFLVSLDPRLPKWVNNLTRLEHGTFGQLPESVALTTEIASLPGFDWKAEATRILIQRHRDAYEAIRKNWLWSFSIAERVESLAKRYQGQFAFDPTALKHEFDLSISLAEFIHHNHVPISQLTRKPGTAVPAHLLAFSALLLFVNAWDMKRAVDDFVTISASLGQAENDLGNLIGLNPFHDYKAWEKLKQLQVANLNVPLDVDLLTERQSLVQELQAHYHVKHTRDIGRPVVA